MFKNLFENKKNYKRIYSILDGKDHLLDFNSFNFYRNIKNFNFQYNFNELNLKIFNHKESLDLTYNMYTEEISFDFSSLSLSRNSIYYKRLQFIMKKLAIEIIQQDDFFRKVNESRKKAKELFNKKSNYYDIYL